MLFSTCAASSGVLGDSSITRFACCRTDAISASSSGAGVERVFQHLDLARCANGSVCSIDSSRNRVRPWTMIDWLPSGSLNSLRIMHATPTVYRSSMLRVFDLGVALRDDADHLFAGHHLVEQVLALLPADVQRHDRAGEDDDVADRQDRQRVGNGQPLPVGAGADDRGGGGAFDDLGFRHGKIVT